MAAPNLKLPPRNTRRAPEAGPKVVRQGFFDNVARIVGYGDQAVGLRPRHEMGQHDLELGEKRLLGAVESHFGEGPGQAFGVSRSEAQVVAGRL